MCRAWYSAQGYNEGQNGNPAFPDTELIKESGKETLGKESLKHPKKYVASAH